jgi:hypothetical protein
MFNTQKAPAARPAAPPITSAGIPIRDPQGRVMFYLDARVSETVRDENGKRVGAATNDGDISLAKAGAALLSGKDIRRHGDGRLVLMDLGVGDVASATGNRANFVSTANDFVADLVAPVRFVSHSLGTYLSEDPRDSIQQTPIAAAAGAAVETADIRLVSQTFNAPSYGIGVRIPSQIAENADFDLQLSSLRRCILAIRLAREIRVANLVLNSANWAAGNIVAATAKWNGGAANPLGDIFATRATSFLPPSTLVFSEAAEQYFYANANSTRVRDFVQAGGQLPRILVGRARTQTAGVPSFVWSPTTPSSAVLLCDPADPKTDIGTIRTLRWLGLDSSPDGIEQDGLMVRTFTHNGFDHVVVIHSDAEMMLTSPSNIGALLTGVLQ